MRKLLLLFAPLAFSLGPSVPVTAASTALASNPERPEHVSAVTASHTATSRTPLASDISLARRSGVRLTATVPASRTASATAPTLPASGAPPQFLTRPYTSWHNITSVFDHCTPDYSTDGKVCEFDGSVGLKSNGVDPGFSLGYAQTPGGSDYLYYDGHNGWDYALNYEPVRAAADGVVQLAGSDSINPCFGQTIIINHPNGYSTRYAHLSQIDVSAGQSVSRAAVIGVSGNTGCSSGPHLHFGVYITSSWTAIDPWGWSGAGGDPWPSDPGNLWMTGYAQYPLPWAPTNVTAVPGDASASVSWTAPGFDGGTPIAVYQVTATPGGTTVNVGGGQTSAVVTGLSNGASYTFTVTAIDAIGNGPASVPSGSVTPNGVPLPPLAVHGVPRTGGATVSWSPPAYTGVGPITGYTVTSSPGNVSVGAGLATTASINGLSNGMTYTFTVTAQNSAGTGSPSAPSNPVTPLLAQSWQPLGGVLSASPAVESSGSGKLDVFIRGSDMQLWERSYAANAWGPWHPLGGVLGSQPAVAYQSNGRIDVFVQGTDQQLWHRAYDGTNWLNWEPLGGVISSAPAAVSWAAGRLDVFVRGTDSQLWHIWYDGAAWNSWEALGGVISGNPAAVSWYAGRVDVFIRGSEGALWHRMYAGGNWASWESLGGVLGSSPSVAAWSSSRLDLMVRGTDANLWHLWYDGSGWSNWTMEDANRFTGDPAAVSWGPGRIDVFVIGTDAGLWHKAFD